MKHLLTALLLSGLMLAESVVAQNVYVSHAIADAIHSGKAYLEMRSQMGPIRMALRGDVAMARMTAMGRQMVTLGTDKASFMLDEQKKTWSVIPNNASPQLLSLRFVGQGTCKVNGESGWYYDEYATQTGQSVTFYYNSDKVAGIAFGGEMKAMGVMPLLSCSATVPADMYFCVGNDWRSSGAASPAPPRCTTPWKDSGQSDELACGSQYDRLAVSEAHRLDTPVYMASLQPAAEPTMARTDMNITEEGIRKALDQIAADTRDMTLDQFHDYIFNFNEDANMAMLCRSVTGEMAEMAIARAHVYPHPVTLSTVAEIYLQRGEMDKAEEYLHEAEDMDADNLIVQTALFDCYFEHEQYGKAHKVIPRLIELYPEDGSTYLNLARLQIVEGDYIEAAANLFKSMSLGHFEEVSAELIMSYLTAIDAAIIASYDDDTVNPKEALDLIFSPENLDLIRKGIACGFNASYTPTHKAFAWDYAASAIESIHESLAKRSETLYQWSSAAYKRSDNAIKDGDTEKRNALYFAMGQKNLGENLQQIMNAATSLGAVQSASPGAKRQVSATLAEGWSNAYAMLTQQLGTIDQVSGYYLPDILSYWGLFLLNRYHMYLYDYYNGGWSYAEDKDDDGVQETLKGCYPPAYESRFKSDLSATFRNKRVDKQIGEKYEKVQEWTIPLELQQMQEIYENEKTYFIALTQHHQQHYNAVVRPEMEAWWSDISLYSQYLMEKNLQEFYQQQALGQLYANWADIFTSSRGSELAFRKQRIEDLKRKLGQLKDEERQQRHEELMELVQDMIDSRQFDYDPTAKLHDLYIELLTPSGTLKYGLIDGKIGYQLYDRQKGTVRGLLNFQYVTQRVYKPLAKQSEAAAYAKDKLKKYSDGVINNAAEAFMGKTALQAAKTLVDARNGDLVKWERESYNAGVMDGLGNVHVLKNIKRETVDFHGRVKGTTEVHQIHNVKRTKHKVEIPAGLFSLHMGRYQRHQ